MTTDKEIKEIRALLQRWYAGETSAGEEEHVGHLLCSRNDLPEDLEAEKRLFSTFRDDGEVPEIPAEYSQRINEALEREISLGRRAPGRVASIRRRHSGWVAAVAAAIAGITALVFVFRDSGSSLNSGHQDLTAREESIHECSENSNSEGLSTVAKATDESRVATAKPAVARNSIVKKNRAPERVGNAGATSVYMHDAGENLRIPENYNVIADVEDADSIMNTIFSRFESKLAMESSKLSNLELDYEFEVIKAQNINNLQYLDTSSNEESAI